MPGPGAVGQNDLSSASPRRLSSFSLSPLHGQNEWRALGVQQSRGWVHYAVHRPEPHIMLFRCVEVQRASAGWRCGVPRGLLLLQQHPRGRGVVDFQIATVIKHC